ncbi:MAG: hypothetical protein OQL06_09005 [Gammaproteobacteria bacterium]|nr:hypothetical protein [Gammaproteobacteria bacterium]
MCNVVCKLEKIKSLILFLSLVLWTTVAVSTDDSYLDALEAEAAASSVVESNTPSVTETQNQPVNQQDIRKSEFEARLAKQLPATFKTYRMLPADEKMMVVNTYFENNQNMPVATRLLFNLYFKVR